MAKTIRAFVALLCCAVARGLSASASSEQAKHRVHHHQHIASDGSMVAGDGAPAVLTSMHEESPIVVQMAVAAKGDMMRRHAPQEETKRGVPRPALLAESHVSCGSHIASECAACVLDHGPDWCHGDCRWDADDGVCKFNLETTAETTTTMKTNAASNVSHPVAALNPSHSETSGDIEDIVAEDEQHMKEADEKQKKSDRDNGMFWLTVGLSAGISALLIIVCALAAICFFVRRTPPKNTDDKDSGKEWALLAEESEVSSSAEPAQPVSEPDF